MFFCDDVVLEERGEKREWGVGRLANPAPGYGGEVGFGNRTVVGFALGTDEGGADGAFPEGAHAFTGIATVRLARGVLGKGGGVDFAEVIFMNPGVARSEDVVAVVEEEAVFVGVAKEVKADDGACGVRVDGVDRLVGAVDPDEFDLAFGGLAVDPCDEGVPVFAATGYIAGLVNDPGDARIRSVCFSNFVNANRRSTDEVPPEAVVTINRGAVAFFFEKCRPPAENDVGLLCLKERCEAEDEKREQGEGLHNMRIMR